MIVTNKEKESDLECMIGLFFHLSDVNDKTLVIFMFDLVIITYILPPYICIHAYDKDCIRSTQHETFKRKLLLISVHFVVFTASFYIEAARVIFKWHS